MNEILTVISDLALTLFTICSLGGVGLSMTVPQIVEPLRNARLLIRLLIGNFVLIPLLGVVLNLALPMSEEGKTAIILMACMAGAPFIPLLVQLAKGHIPLAAASMVLLTIISIFYAPLMVPLLLPDVAIDVLEIAQALLISMLVPLIVGLIIKRRHPDAAARFQPKVHQVSMVAALVLFLAVLPITLPTIIASIGAWIIPASVLLALGSILVGYLMGWGRDNIGYRKATAFSAGQRNMAGALIVAATLSGEIVAMTLVALAVLTAVTVIVALEWGKRTADVGEEAS